MDVAEAREMLAAAQLAGVVNMLGNEFRYTTERALLTRAINDGMIGELLAIIVGQVSNPSCDRL